MRAGQRMRHEKRGACQREGAFGWKSPKLPKPRPIQSMGGDTIAVLHLGKVRRARECGTCRKLIVNHRRTQRFCSRACVPRSKCRTCKVRFCAKRPGQNWCNMRCERRFKGGRR